LALSEGFTAGSMRWGNPYAAVIRNPVRDSC
jgi:hypothetical protein